MDKFAQKRNIWNKIREKTNLTGIAAEKFFNKQFADAMEKLRINDDKIRKIMLGEEVSDTSMKALISQVQDSIKQREYVDAFMELGKIHNQLTAIKGLILDLKMNMSAVHEDMLLSGFKETEKMPEKEKERVRKRRQELADLQKRLAQRHEVVIIKNANFLTSFYKNIFTEPGRARMAWEKKYPKEVEKWRSGSNLMLTNSKDLYTNLIEQLKIMAKARSVRNLDKYVEAAEALVPQITNFDKSFRDYYTNAIKPLVAKLELDNPNKPEEKNEEVSEQLQNQEIDVEVEEMGPETDKSPGNIAGPQTDPGLKKMFNKLPLPSEVSDEESGPVGLLNPQPLKSAHEEFYSRLTKIASEKNINDVKNFIQKYAKVIENKDFATSLKLKSLAAKISSEE